MLSKILLAPLLLWQGRQVRRRALRLPEATGARTGVAGNGEPGLKVLILGDSSAAGVGAATQTEALAGRLSAALAHRMGLAVHWQLLASTGHTTADALAALQQAELEPADVLVTALGVNDVVAQVRTRAWLQRLDQIDRLARERLGVRYTLHSAVPPMHAFPLLPQPLRWVLGGHALRMNRALARRLMGAQGRQMQAMPAHLHARSAAEQMMARDGFHPGPAGYRVWAEVLAERIEQAGIRSR